MENKIITNSTNGNVYPLFITNLQSRDIDDVCAVQDFVVRTLGDPTSYAADPRETLLECLGAQGLTIGAYAGDQLVGFRSILCPGDRPANLGREIGLSEPSLLGRVAHLQRACVLPEFRGNRLQIRMTNLATQILNERMNYRYLMSTVAPGNYPSMEDKFTSGMLIVKLTRNHDDHQRYVFFRDLEDVIALDPAQTQVVDGLDVATQLNLLGASPRHAGYRQSRRDGRTLVHFAPLPHAIPRERARVNAGP